MLMDKLKRMAMGKLREEGHILPTFFIPKGDRVVACEFETIDEECLDVVRDEVGSGQRYLCVYVAYMMRRSFQGANIAEAIQSMQLTEEGVTELREMLSTVLSRPADNPLKEQALVVTECDRRKGTTCIIIPFEEVDGEVVFKQEIVGSRKRQFVNCNIWSKYEVELND